MSFFPARHLQLKQNLLSPSLTRDVSTPTVGYGCNQNTFDWKPSRKEGILPYKKFEKSYGNAEQKQTSSTTRNVISSDSQHEEVERKLSAVANTGRHPFSASISVHMTFYCY